MQPCRVSVILINYNTSRYTLDCVDSVLQHTRTVPVELVVVDNNSAPEDAEKLRVLVGKEHVKLVRSRLNLGFAGGNMLGVQHADPESRYLFFLNNDCIFENDVIGILIRYLEAHEAVAACTGQILHPDGSRAQSFDYLPELKTKILGHALMRRLHPEAFPPVDAVYTEPLPVPMITGCAMMVRASAFAQLGGLDTNLFLYCEEEDLCKRLGDAGHKIVFVPEARMVHFGGSSTEGGWDIQKEFFISFFYYLRKHYSLAGVWGMRLIYFFKNFRKGFSSRLKMRLAFFILKGAPPGSSLRFRQRIS